jgi:hypothetical protein
MDSGMGAKIKYPNWFLQPEQTISNVGRALPAINGAARTLKYAQARRLCHQLIRNF